MKSFEWSTTLVFLQKIHNTISDTLTRYYNLITNRMTSFIIWHHYEPTEPQVRSTFLINLLTAMRQSSLPFGSNSFKDAHEFILSFMEQSGWTCLNLSLKSELLCNRCGFSSHTSEVHFGLQLAINSLSCNSKRIVRRLCEAWNNGLKVKEPLFKHH